MPRRGALSPTSTVNSRRSPIRQSPIERQRPKSYSRASRVLLLHLATSLAKSGRFVPARTVNSTAARGPAAAFPSDS
jgi:hypothetical protein